MNSKKFVDIFISELESRIDLLNNLDIGTLNKQNYDELISLLKEKNVSLPVYKDDLEKFELSEIETILKLINEFDVESIISDYFGNKTFYMELITTNVNRFIDECNNLNENQKKMRKDKVALYKKYIKLFKDEKFDELFTSIDELEDLLFTLNINYEDRYLILKYVNDQNSHIMGDVDYDLIKKIKEITSLSLCNKKYVKIVKNYINENEIDIDLIPLFAGIIADENNLNYDITLNVLSSLILINLVEHNNLYAVEDVLSYIKQDIIEEDMNILDECKNIVKEYYSLLEEFEQYNKNIPYEDDIEYRKMSIVGLMKKIINEEDIMNKNLFYTSLAELLESYNEINNIKKK